MMRGGHARVRLLDTISSCEDPTCLASRAFRILPREVAALSVAYSGDALR